jgi:hypothetical protein
LIAVVVTVAGCVPPGPGAPPDVTEVQRTFDRDLDGFADALDPAPDDRNIPADLGSPEAILANPYVAKALAEARSRGLTFEPRTELDSSFDVSGTYAFSATGTNFLMTSDHTGEGRRVAAGTATYTRQAAGLYRALKDQHAAEGDLESAGVIHLRGTSAGFTAYGTGEQTCSNGSPSFSAGIMTGSVDPISGDLVNVVNLSVVVAVMGEGHCNLPGGDHPGGWQVVTGLRLRKN